MMRESITAHISDVTKKRMHKCSECPQEFRDHSLLRRHLTRSHPNVNLVGCPECFEMFRDTLELGKHLALHVQDQPHKCSLCPQRFSSPKGLRKHVQCVHRVNGKPVSCSLCGMKFRWPSDLRRHEASHSSERPFECLQCPWKFKLMRQLKRHALIHSGLKPYVCNQCGKGFTEVSSLNRHIRAHYDIRPFACSFCDLKFKHSYNLSDHLITHNRFSPIVAVSSSCIKSEPYVVRTVALQNKGIDTVSNISYDCAECGLSFLGAKEYLRHLRVHKQRGSHTCRQCNMEFSALPLLEAHLRNHVRNVSKPTTFHHVDQASPYKGQSSLQSCDIARKKSPSIRAMSVKPYRCTECGQVFGKSDSLWYHLLRHLGRFE